MTQIKKISVVKLKMFLSTLPLTKGQQSALKDMFEGYGIGEQIILLPEIIDVKTILHPVYDGPYTIADILEMSTGSHSGDLLRVIIMEGDKNWSDQVKPMPVRILMEPREEGIEQPYYSFLGYTPDLHADLLEGVSRAIDECAGAIAQAHANAAWQAGHQLDLQRAV